MSVCNPRDPVAETVRVNEGVSAAAQYVRAVAGRRVGRTALLNLFPC